MQKLNFNNQWHDENIRRNGVRFGTPFELTPFSDHTIKAKVSRKSYIFTSQKQELNSWTYILPKIKVDHFHFCLELTAAGYYLFRSDCDSPFRINGNLSYCSIVELGDRIEFGLNQLLFKNESKSTDEVQIDEAIVKSNLPVLLEGETGTGKSRLARLIHEQSGRVGRFVHINLSAFSRNLFESELFGHKKGSFTGAMNDKLGAIIDAHKGTLFIDEVDSLPEELQVKLLLFLDSQMVRAVGSSVERKVDVRLIFASGRELETLVELSELRRDFFYRLRSGFKKKLEPLRESRQSVISFIDEYEVSHGVIISNQLREFYINCPWPGNYRQLKSHLDYKKIISKSLKIEWSVDDEQLLNFPTLIRNTSKKFISFRELKKSYFNFVFHQCGKHYHQSAKILEVSPTTLRDVLKKAC